MTSILSLQRRRRRPYKTLDLINFGSFELEKLSFLGRRRTEVLKRSDANFNYPFPVRKRGILEALKDQFKVLAILTPGAVSLSYRLAAVIK